MDNTIVKNITSQSIDKAAIKIFAVYARNKLINDIKNKAAMIGVTESGIQKPLSTSTGNLQLFDIGMQEPYRIEGKAIEQRNGLIRELEKRTQGSSYSIAYETLIEEVAYTWFNRIIAIRFMEVNNYMPDRMRILSSGVEGVNEPEFIRHVFESNFQFNAKEKETIIELKTDGSNLAMDELFQYLFIKQCNALNSNLPELFEKTNDYTELLLTVSYNDVEGVIYKLVHDVPEENFDVNSENGNGQIEIIGWLYQYYNTELKAEVFGRPKSKRIEKHEIPAATQLFTPEWIVKYMVENSLGRLWLEGHYDIDLRNGWNYYIDEPQQEKKVKESLNRIRDEYKNIKPEEIKVIDPAMGSGHILIYSFDVLLQIYESCGYTKKQAVRNIIEKNLYGLDIDNRAYQLSYFSIMMKARQYDRNFLDRKVNLNIYVILESNKINRSHLNFFGQSLNDNEKNNAIHQFNSLLDSFRNAKEYGSILNIGSYAWSLLTRFSNNLIIDKQISFDNIGIEITQQELKRLISLGEVMTQKYDVVITNPPYMGSDKMNSTIDTYVKKYFPVSRYDLYAVFIEQCMKMAKKHRFVAMITQHSWMYLSSYEKLRKRIFTFDILNMTHLGSRAFEEIQGEVVQTTSFILRNSNYATYTAKYIRLNGYNNPLEKKQNFFNAKNFFTTSKKAYEKIPGNNIAYWATKKMISYFENYPSIGEIAKPRQGLASGDNKFFYRFWHEIDFKLFIYDAKSKEDMWNKEKKYVPVNKGGGYKRWYGNNYEVLKFDEENYNLLLRSGNNLPSRDKYFLEGVTWGKISSASFSSRYSPTGFLFSDSGMKITGETDKIKYILAFLQSSVAPEFLKVFSETIHYETGNISRIPIIINQQKMEEINQVVDENICLVKHDWDSYEFSWDFKKHPLINGNDSIEVSFEKWDKITQIRYIKLKKNEEKLDRGFIELYSMDIKLDHEIEENQISIRKADSNREVKSFISYAVGCMFGRYTLNMSGLVYAGGKWNDNIYKTFIPTKDNILLISEHEYFEDEITERFISFVKEVYGMKTLEKNLEYIAENLNGRGATPREIIKNYFTKDFFKSHCKDYYKRPIYWLYDSGKQNGFKALVYMHRYDEDTTGKVRVDYLHPVQRAYERTIVNLQDDIANSKDAKESTQLQKQLEKVTKQLKECRDYDERLGHMALERVGIDLDDGVKVNYDKVQTDSKGKFHQILAKIK
ncbi:BREX-1 system adenine-specific DNA-methyltransferase PglX [Jeotgalibaca sp. A127]|uniref:BREX-1 system adenine-specific DNA-methyltransferase PglX n=1 Tax=Jeotgalibaca sp. A127 TaxID=3457324 RepID=UPI003FCFE924